MTVGILGGGFGLYGYLPGLVGTLGQTVILPQRYREIMTVRSDTARFLDAVEWARDDHEVMARSSALVITRRPVDQLELVAQALLHPNVQRFLLEKPIAPEPLQARELLERLRAARRPAVAGFNFRHTDWGRRLLDWVKGRGPNGSLAIDWTFTAHHYATDLDTWKRRHSEGGGALRFFGTHLIALLAEAGFRQAETSQVAQDGFDDVRSWSATMVGPDLPRCRIHVDSRADMSKLAVVGRNARPGADFALSQAGPFEAMPIHRHGLDARVGIMSDISSELLSQGIETAGWLEHSVKLWLDIEQKTLFAVQ